MRKVFSTSLLFAMAALLLLAAACGGGDDDDSGGDAVTATSAADGGADTGGADEEEDEPTPSEDAGDDEPDETDDAGGGDAGDAVDVCAIVSRGEAGDTLGSPVLEGELSVDNFTDATCEWQSEDGLAEISVEVRSGDPDRFTEFYELSEGEPVEDLGNRAKWDSLYGIEVLTDEHYINVFTINFSLDDETRRARSIELARTVIERLQ